MVDSPSVIRPARLYPSASKVRYWVQLAWAPVARYSANPSESSMSAPRPSPPPHSRTHRARPGRRQGKGRQIRPQADAHAAPAERGTEAACRRRDAAQRRSQLQRQPEHDFTVSRVKIIPRHPNWARHTMPTPTTRTLNPLPFNMLEPKRFEDLVRQLAYDFRHWQMLEATGRIRKRRGIRRARVRDHDRRCRY